MATLLEGRSLDKNRGELSQSLFEDEGKDYDVVSRPCAMSMLFGVLSTDEVVAERFRPVLIVGQMFFKNPIDVSVLKDALRRRLLEIRRFRCVVREAADKAIHLKVVRRTHIQMDYHVKAMSKSDESPWTRAEVDRLCSRIYEQEGAHALDYAHPPWRFHVFRMEDGRTLVLPVIDHVLVDGVAAVAALMVLLDDEPGPVAAQQAPKTKRDFGPPMSITGRLQAFGVGLKEALLTPQLAADRPTILKEKDHRNPSMKKTCVAGEKVSLEEMKRIKSKLPGASVNDIMLATLTMTLQKYFKQVGQESLSLRGNFPINLRDPKQDVLQNSMGNRFVGGNFTFYLNEHDPVKLVWRIKSQLDTLKRSPAPRILDALFGLLVPRMITGGKRPELIDMVLDTYGKVTVMLSNVPGPSAQVRLCGQPLDDLMFYTLVGIGAYFGILSYNGEVSVGISTSEETEPEPERISKHWAPAFEELVRAVDAASPEKLEAPRSYGDHILVGLLVLGVACIVKSQLFG